jgi:hypothetical protein
MKNKSAQFLVAAAIIGSMAGCKKDETVSVAPPSEGTSVTFNGGAGGASAVNAAYVDLSTDKADTVKRSSWDLGFYCGADFRVILNNTTSAGAKVLTTADLAAVGETDTIGLTLATSQADPLPEHLAYFDAINGAVAGTVIPAVSATATDNKVVIINRGTGGATPARPWIKAKITRNASGGYTLQYGTITQTTGFTSVDIPKDAEYNFKYVSFDGGATVNVQPKKTAWDFTWGYSVYQTNFGTGIVPYNFSDLIAINHLAGVQALSKVYASDVVRNAAYTAFNTDSVTVAASAFSADRWAIGSSWRSTQPATGVRTDRFYVIKDVAGNYYKLKFISMGVNDGGERGKPVFEYKLIK